jgi:hypothetical protein
MSENKINVDITDTEIRNKPYKTGINKRTYVTEFFYFISLLISFIKSRGSLIKSEILRTIR